jgi:hypothetical protein
LYLGAGLTKFLVRFKQASQSQRSTPWASDRVPPVSGFRQELHL